MESQVNCPSESPQSGVTAVPLLFMVHHAMARIADRLSGPVGLTASRWLLLCVLDRWRRVQQDWPTVGQISARAKLSVQAVSRMVAELERMGIVRRSRRAGAGRAVYVSLTRRGARILDTAHALARPLEQVFVDSFSGPRLRRFESDLDQLLRNLLEFEDRLESR